MPCVAELGHEPGIGEQAHGHVDLPRLPRTEEAVKEILSLPIYGDLPMEDVDLVCDAILEFFGKK